MATATEPQADEVLQKLLARSREKKVAWRRLQPLSSVFSAAEQYVASLPNASIILRQLVSGDVTAAIVDSRGDRVGELNPEPTEPRGVLLRDLLFEARQQSSRLDDTLSKLSLDLDRI